MGPCTPLQTESPHFARFLQVPSNESNGLVNRAERRTTSVGYYTPGHVPSLQNPDFAAFFCPPLLVLHKSASERTFFDENFLSFCLNFMVRTNVQDRSRTIGELPLAEERLALLCAALAAPCAGMPTWMLLIPGG